MPGLILPHNLRLLVKLGHDANVSVNRTAYNLFVDGDDTGFINHTFFDSVSIKSGISGTALGTLRLFEASNNGTNYVALRSPTSLSSNVTFTLPSADGSANQILKTDGAGNLSFVTESAETTINNNAANRVITGSGSANTLNAEALLTFGNSTGSGSNSSLEISGGSFHPPVLSLLNTTGSSTTDFATISHDSELMRLLQLEMDLLEVVLSFKVQLELHLPYMVASIHQVTLR